MAFHGLAEGINLKVKTVTPQGADKPMPGGKLGLDARLAKKAGVHPSRFRKEAAKYRSTGNWSTPRLEGPKPRLP